MLFTFVNFGLNPSGAESSQLPESLSVTEAEYAHLPALSPDTYQYGLRPPFLGKGYIGFREALAFKESGGDYFTTNTLGYLGKYQFGLTTLQLMGIHNPAQFLGSPELQEKVFDINLSRNKWILRRDIPRFVGRRINGIEVTESGILAAAHLAGAGNVKKYLRSGGQLDVTDAYGTSISHYLRAFRGYDTSPVSPVKNPRIEAFPVAASGEE